jgi:hypothetical protein
MPSARELWEFLNNASVGAAVGAIGAYLAVRFSDKARDRAKAARVIPRLLEAGGELARQRQQSLGGRDAAPAGQVQIILAPGFDSGELNRIAIEASPHLSLRQRLAISKVLFYMKMADDSNERMRLLLANAREGV